METDPCIFPRRMHERVQVVMPVHIAGKTGQTRDVSIGGIYFELDDDIGLGNEIHFEVEVATPDETLCLQCSGQIVRKEQKHGRTGIAVRLTEEWLQVVQ